MLRLEGQHVSNYHKEKRYCLRHIAANYYQRYKSDEERIMILRMGNAHRAHEVDALLSELCGKNEQGYNYMLGIPREKWLRAYDGGHRYGHMTTNLTEVINSSLKGTRHLPITSVVKATYYRLATRFVKLSKEAMDWMVAGHIFKPELQQLFHTSAAHANAMGAICFSRHQNQFQVSEYSRPLEGIVQNNYVVDLRHRTCDCDIFQTFKYPCAHVFAACASVHFDVMTLVDPVYRLQTVFKVYRNESFPATRPMTLILHCDTDLHGRPHSTRIHCAEDMIVREPTGQAKHCSICSKPDHTKKKCPLKSGPRIG
ncbi:hypothetical protein GQ457_06G022340 [Hibiscus cannabinus]